MRRRWGKTVGKTRLIRAAIALALAGVSAGAHAATLGIASQYNEFILGNASYQNSDIQGKVAVGGNFSAVGTALAGNAGAGNNIIVGGNFTNTNGSVNGNVVIGGNAVLNNPSIYGSVSAGGSVYINPNGGGTAPTSVRYGTTYTKPSWMNPSAQQGTTTVPIDFAAEFTNLKNISVGQVNAADPYALFQYSQAYFNSSGTGIKAFNVSASTLAAATGGYNIAAAAGATVIINVSGTSASLLNTGFNLTGGIQASNLIWNFYEATTLNFDGSVTGTVLAPKAAVTANYGGFNGTLIAASLMGSGGNPTSLEAHTGYTFTGLLRDPPAAAVPEPATLGLFGLGVLALGLRRRRKM